MDGTPLQAATEPPPEALEATYHSNPELVADGGVLTGPPQPPAESGRDISSPDGVPGGGRELSTPGGGRNLGTGTGSIPRTTPTTQDIKISSGDMINEYQITGRVGEGGMGTVYEGVQPVIGKRVAIKVLLREFASNNEVVGRFIQEARAANQAQSRYIVDIFSFGELCDGRHYFVMEYLDGKSLREYLDREQVLGFDAAYAILSAMARGLSAAHKVGIIHRDIKPENIIVLEEGDGTLGAKVLDFGIAKLQGSAGSPSFVTRTGAALGTPYYMSPEQCRGQQVDHRTDIYAVGIIMFEMFTGTLPFKANSYIELVNKHLFASPPVPSSIHPGISPQLDTFILRCIAKNPDERPQSMQQLRTELSQLRPSLSATNTSGALPAVSDDTSTPAARPGKKSRAGLWIGLVVVLLLGGGGGAGAFLYTQGHLDGLLGSETTGGAGGAQAGAGSSDKRGGAGDKHAGGSDKHGGAGDKHGGAGDRQADAGDRQAGADSKQVSDSGPQATAAAADASVATSGQLVVRTGLARAVYFIDGKRVGGGKRVELEEIAVGDHELTIKAPRRRTLRETITIEAGKTHDLERLLRRKGGRTSPRTGTDTPGQEDPDVTLDPFKKRSR